MPLLAVAALAAALAHDPLGGPLADPLTDAQAWARMPESSKGTGQPLPVWVRSIASQLPKTAAAFLELDTAQRTASPIDPKLRAAMRWVAAHANRCDYAQAVAASDAHRAGLSDDLLSALASDGFPGWPAPERNALEFARLMTVDSDSIPDDLFESLADHFGPNQAASMVLLLAYANYQDRALLLLRAQVEPGGPLPPLEVSFDQSILGQRSGRSAVAPPFSSAPSPTGTDVIDDASDSEWASLSYDDLQTRLEAQRAKPTRLSIPDWPTVAKRLPKALADRPSDIIWYRIAFGYAPELAVPFEVLMRTAGAEAAGRYDRVFGQSLFWITTRAVRCPYCMGHCEMNWEVAGLTKDQIAERSRVLASSDWSSFPPAEQHAFAFARKLAREPWSVTDADLDQLVSDNGRDKALIIALQAARHHYMVRISNGFQLKLERENVFFDYHGVPRPSPSAAR